MQHGCMSLTKTLPSCRAQPTIRFLQSKPLKAPPLRSLTLMKARQLEKGDTGTPNCLVSPSVCPTSDLYRAVNAANAVSKK